MVHEYSTFSTLDLLGAHGESLSQLLLHHSLQGYLKTPKSFEAH